MTSVQPVDASTLYIVATPIGNRDDITLRALGVLAAVDCIYAEDTRHSQALLSHHGIATRRIALHEHNENARTASVVEQLLSGGTAALISDAGTPLINDPGYRLVRACHEAGVNVSPIPGPSALIAALSVCGLPTDRFEYLGFPPSRQAARLRWLKALTTRAHTLVFYESTHRIEATLQDMASSFGPSREMCIARELTKRFETLVFGTIENTLQILADDPLQRKGEFVLLVRGVEKPDVRKDAEGLSDLSINDGTTDTGTELVPGPDKDALIIALLSHLPIRRVARVVADLYQLPKRQVYNRALEIQRELKED